MTEPAELPRQPWMGKNTYYQYNCVNCGKETTNSYCEPHKTRMLANTHCFTCDFWVEQDEKMAKDHANMTIINGHIYSPGNRTSGSFRGMAGRRFDIEYISPSKHAGSKISTFDLWSGSTMPDTLRSKYPDTAVFLNGAERQQIGETGCWNPSDQKAEPYPLPRSLGLG